MNFLGPAPVSRPPMWVILGAALAAGCSSSSPGAPSGDDGAVARSPLSRDAMPSVTEADRSALAAGNNAFAFDMLAQLHPGGDNLFFSPYSISSALAMTYAGAAGKTATEMASTMHFTLPQAQLHPAFDWLDLQLASRATRPTEHEGSGVELHVANSLWGYTGDTFEPPFLDTLAKDYGSGLRLVDFAGHPDECRQAINAWVSDATNAKIPDILSEPGMITSDVRVALANAVYFKANWDTPFPSPQPGNFTRAGGGTVAAELMTYLLEGAKYAAGDGYQAVEIPYDGRAVAMDIVLPTAGTESAFASHLDAGTILPIFAALEPSAAYVTLPKFRIAGQTIDLSAALKAMGMTTAFSALADFSGITKTEPLALTHVFHQAFVGVDENGTEAAASTVVTAGETADPLDPPTLRADHPFFFVIRDLATNTILFTGWLADPS